LTLMPSLKRQPVALQSVAAVFPWDKSSGD
jgi:hypothetical protein